MWDETMQSVLKNMEDIRNDQRNVREQLASACTSGGNDTQLVIAAIQEATDKILAAVNPQPPIRNEPWWRFW